MPFNGEWLDKSDNPHEGILLSNKKEWAIATRTA